ncbi:HK97 gp10 family phage protein [Cellulosilyticum sp. ST5]|uniref:HK97 gp10 family phage protein n=1 Tax=Cellulosilyticum sp. ST5 TaxID=3055805 RepID=UPI00397727FA
MGLEIQGLDTMQKKLNYISTRYPYESEILLTKMGNKFRNSVKKKTPDSGVTSKRKLMKSYRVSRVKGAGKDLYVEFRSTSPHFHLVERGHKVVDKNGRDTGKRVQGKFMVEQTALEYQKSFPKEVEKMVDNLLRGLK